MEPTPSQAQLGALQTLTQPSVGRISSGAATMSVADQHALGMRITALPAINAIPAVHAAAPGIRTYQDLPTIGAGGRLHAPPA